MHLGEADRDFVSGLLIRRYKRFLADCRLLDGSLVTAHCPNTGSMKTLLGTNRPVRLTWHDNPRRKLPWTLTLLGVADNGWALVDTSLPNHIVAEGIRAGVVAGLRGYDTMRREVGYGSRRSRVDLLLSDEEGRRPSCYVEVKNVTMASDEERRADFPDARTTRGKKHLLELADMVAAGHRAVMFYLLGRTDRDHVGIASGIDPDYAETLRAVMARGVEVLCHRLVVDGPDLTLGPECPFVLDN